MADKDILVIERDSEGQYDDYREKVYVSKHESVEKALEYAASQALVITDSCEVFNKAKTAALLLKGTLGKPTITFTEGD